MPTISPSRTVRLTSLTRRTPLPSTTFSARTSSTTATRLRRLLVHPQQHLAPDHQFGKLVAAGGCRFDVGDHLAPAHHGDRIGQVHDLAQLVGDDDDRLALVPQRPEDAEQVVGLLRGQDPGRLVQDQDVGAAIERLEDFDALLKADGQVADDGVDIHLQRVFMLQPLQLLAGAAEAGGQRGAALGPEQHVFHHGEGVHQHEMLVDHADAGGDGVAGGADVGRLAVDFARSRCRRADSRRRCS